MLYSAVGPEEGVQARAGGVRGAVGEKEFRDTAAQFPDENRPLLKQD